MKNSFNKIDSIFSESTKINASQENYNLAKYHDVIVIT